MSFAFPEFACKIAPSGGRTGAGPPGEEAEAIARSEGSSLRRHVFNIIDSSTPGDGKGLWFDRLMTVLILTNVTVVILETVEELAQEFHGFFFAFELFSVAVFSIESLLRVWACVEEPEAVPSDPLKRRLRFMGTTPGIDRRHRHPALLFGFSWPSTGVSCASSGCSACSS